MQYMEHQQLALQSFEALEQSDTLVERITELQQAFEDDHLALKEHDEGLVEERRGGLLEQLEQLVDDCEEQLEQLDYSEEASEDKLDDQFVDEQHKQDVWFEENKEALYDHFTAQEQQLTEQFE